MDGFERKFWIFIPFLTLVFGKDLPQELDPFLELLFATPECETFMSNGDFLSVNTIQCSPFVCDFPRQLCMRPANLYTDEKANMCKDIPEECVTAANDGVPIPKTSATLPIAPTLGSVQPPQIPLTPSSGLVPASICDQGAPDGRFCGFALKYTYNKETGNCEQFWFPGCSIETTNNNLFDTEQQCIKATRHCKALPPTPAPPSIITQSPIVFTTALVPKRKIRRRIIKPVTTTTPEPTTTIPEPIEEKPDLPVWPGNSGRNSGGLGSFLPMGGNSAGGILPGLASQFLGGGGNSGGGGGLGSFLGGGNGGSGSSGGSSLVGSFLGSGIGGGGGNGGGYGGGPLGSGNGGGGGNSGFVGLIANAVKEVGNMKAGGGGGGNLLKNIDANQISNILSAFG